MDDELEMTPEQAREHLGAADASSLVEPRDRALHAGATAVFGLVLGASAIVGQRIDGSGGALVSVAIWVVALAALLWVEKEASTTPLHARRWSRIGFGASLLLHLIVVTPWLNQRAQERPESWPVLLLAALVVAVPSLIAAFLIRRDRR